jgi:hypothetical protein
VRTDEIMYAQLTGRWEWWMTAPRYPVSSAASRDALVSKAASAMALWALDLQKPSQLRVWQRDGTTTVIRLEVDVVSAPRAAASSARRRRPRARR